jgi:hypothetical protein|tara:strand:+ start:545 stop:1093 length:549 start_codon:yes stop_codon:yes gene_type:complete
MKLNLFSIPIYISNIDVDRIKLINQTFEKRWLSETTSSHNAENLGIDPENAKYLLGCISKLISKDIKTGHSLELANIWENQYKENDFQEKHDHPFSHFSFIVYKDIDKSHTVFFNPSLKSMTSYYPPEILDNFNGLDENFAPECRKGQLLVFPSFVDHMVRKHSNSITIAGNVLIKETKSNP